MEWDASETLQLAALRASSLGLQNLADSSEAGAAKVAKCRVEKTDRWSVLSAVPHQQLGQRSKLPNLTRSGFACASTLDISRARATVVVSLQKYFQDYGPS